jgi:hypothetical protein
VAFEVTLRVNGVPVGFVMDTGAEVTVITHDTFCDLQTPLCRPTRILTGANSRILDVYGEAKVSLKSKSKVTAAVVSVMMGARKNLLGIQQIRELGLLAIVDAVCNESFDPIGEFSELFGGLGVMPETFRIELAEDTKPLRLFTPRSIPAGLRDKAKAELDSMLDQGVIQVVERPTEWCSGLTIAPKANGKIRMCVDLTMLNKGVAREIYPLPRVNEMLASLAEGNIFSKLDANSGFWQVKLDPESQPLTTFITPWGRFCFRRMPFGITSAPEFFQRSMEKILHGLPGVICLMDDVLVYGVNEKEHWARLRTVLQCISRSGMTLRKEKCEFGCREVKFLGHIISGVGVKPDPDKIKAIVDMCAPTTKKEARRFLGMVNYLSKFSSKLAELCAPINALTGSKSSWWWGEDQQVAFDKIKIEMSRTPVLCKFDVSKKHRVSADSSQFALGAVLLQFGARGSWQPVEYASRKLTVAESRYAMVEKEALAITWACERFDYYLVGRQFEVETDHKPLLSILGEKDLSQLPLRVQRFKMRMMRYDFEIFHTPGVQMYLADSLSRPVVACVGDKEMSESTMVEAFVAACVKDSVVGFRENELYNALQADSDANLCREFILNAWPRSSRGLEGEAARLYSCRSKLSECEGFIMYGARFYIPTSLRPRYLALCHEGHQGIEKSRRQACQQVWWPGLSVDLEEYVRKCEICVKHSQVKHQPVVDTGLPEGPWVEIGADLFHFEDKIYLVLVDYYSKWIEPVLLRSQGALAVVMAMKRVFSCFGVPKVVRSDNGGCFDSNCFREFVADWGFAFNTSSPNYPQSNGMAERSVGIIKNLWRKSDDRLAALLAYRATPLSTGFSPGELMFGRCLRSKVGLSRGE